MKYQNALKWALPTFVIFAIFLAGFFGQKEVSGQTTQVNPQTKIVAFGDSLVVGVGSTSGNDFVSVLSRRINLPIENMGVSGDTTASALSRVGNVISRDPDIVILLIGGNDILQRLPVDQMFINIKSIVTQLQSSGAKVILVGLRNDVFGVDYESRYRNVATETGAAYVPGVLDGILGSPSLSADAVHPNDAGYQIVADRIFPVLQTTINSIPNQTLTVTCSANKTTLSTGQSVTWTAYTTGGDGNYTYSWSGTDGLSNTSSTFTQTYTSIGDKNATVTVTSGGVVVTQNCTNTVLVKEPVILGKCGVDAASTGTNTYEYRVIFEANQLGTITGTNSYVWSGTTGRSVTNTNPLVFEQYYTTPGLKVGNVEITSGAQKLRLTCSVDLPADTGIPTTGTQARMGGRCNSTTIGNTVSWTSSVTGVQGPYTYEWSGTDGLTASSTSPIVSKTYTSDGIKTANVKINGGGQSITFSCQTMVSNDGSAPGGGCFIATAAYGTEMESEVQTLRNFRDRELMQSNVGRKIVSTYYEYSPPVADYIREDETLKLVVRGVLSPVVSALNHLGYDE